jgi:NAD(P)H-dependent FMN reductase
MITLIAGTNRQNSNTRIVTEAYSTLLKSKGLEHHCIFLEDLPQDYVFRNDVLGNPSPEFSALVKEKIVPASKLVIIAPEYNGGFPGALKAFIDGIWPENLKHKKAALVGVASGRAGNLRGLDHLTNVLHYLKVHVFYKKVPISGVDKLIEEGILTDTYTLDVLNDQVNEFTNWN